MTGTVKVDGNCVYGTIDTSDGANSTTAGWDNSIRYTAGRMSDEEVEKMVKKRGYRATARKLMKIRDCCAAVKDIFGYNCTCDQLDKLHLYMKNHVVDIKRRELNNKEHLNLSIMDGINEEC